MSRLPEAAPNGIVIQINYKGQEYEYLVKQANFEDSFTVCNLKLEILEELGVTDLNHHLVIVKDSEEEVLIESASLSQYHSIFQETVCLEIRHNRCLVSTE